MAARLALAAVVVAMVGTGAMAQVGTPSADQLLQQRQLQNQMQTPVLPRETVLEPTAPSTPLPVSQLEQILSERAGTQLRQFGYDQLGVGRAVTVSQVGGVQDTYILGVGDEIVLTLRGQENSEYRAVVDRDGNVAFPRLNPLSAAGRNFGQFRQDLINTIRKAYNSTEGFVTIGRLRQISVLVSGEVGSPGVRTLTGLSTVVDAIFVSGGIKKSGSLRSVRIQRGGQERTVDLYSMLVGKVRSSNVTLADGDKVIVPPIGATVAVAGEARRAGIYELAAGQSTIRVRDAVALASGITVPGAYRVSQLRTMPDGKRQLVDVTGAADSVLHDGEIAFVQTSVNMSINQVTLMGAVRTPGAVALGKFKTIHELLPSSDVFQHGAYLLFGVIERTDPTTLQRTVVPFSPLAVVQGKTNFALMSDDNVHILTKTGMRKLIEFMEAPEKESASAAKARGADVPTATGRLQRGTVTIGDLRKEDMSADVGGLPRSESAPTDPLSNIPDRDLPIANRTTTGQSERPDAVVGASNSSNSVVTPGTKASGEGPGPNSVSEIATDPDLGGFKASQASLRTLAHYRVVISGAVYDPGEYLAIPGTPVADLLVAADGLTDDADLNSFELTSTIIDNNSGASTTQRKLYPATNEMFASLGLKSYDRLVFRNVYSDRNGGLVTVSGEVRYPGSFDILRGEKLSSVLRRAGGFTEIAYPEGAVFQRISVAKAEREESVRIVADMRSQLLAYLLKPQANGSSQPLNSDAIAAVQGLLTQISSTPAIGRVPLVANLATIEKHPELDTMLEPGDTIVVPKRPSTVLVMGEVLRAGAQRFYPSMNVDDYIDRAGGTTEVADASRIIVVLPDGSVRNNGNSWLNFGSDSDIPPGSTVFVPRKLEVYGFRQLLTDSLQIASSLATTAAALAVLSKQ